MPKQISLVASRPILASATILTLTTLLLFLRRPDQFYAPYIWVEDGTKILPEFIRDGWFSLFYAVNGYQILATRLLTTFSLKASFLYFPIVSLLLTILSTSLVVALISFAPTDLRCKPLCALAALLLPTDPEVLGIGEYIFWWAGLTLFVALIWTPNAAYQWVRMICVGLGGLSSPIIITLLPLFLLRGALLRNKRGEIATLTVAIAATAAQMITMIQTGDHVAAWNSKIWEEIPSMIEKFFGYYINGSGDWNPMIRFSIGSALLTLLVLHNRRLSLTFGLLTVSLFLVIITTIQRVPASVAHPYLAGPRYFFYPYIILSWLLIWIGISSRQWMVRTVAVGTVGASILWGLPTIARHHIHVDWREQVAACAKSETFNFPIHFDGSKNMWSIQLSGADCTALVNGGLVGHF
jgi:hypothetical protein